MLISYSICLLPYLLAVAAVVTVILRLRSSLAKLPGPRYTAFTSLVLKYHEFTHGRRLYIHRLHQKYGPVVRLAPDEVSFATADAVKEIYMSGGSGYDKTPFYSLFTQFGTRTLFSTLPRADVSAGPSSNFGEVLTPAPFSIVT